MIKFLIAVFALCCSLQSFASVQTHQADTLSNENIQLSNSVIEYNEPTYQKGVISTSPWNGNWFFDIAGGANAFLGTPIGCADLFGRIQPSLQVSVGKWFLPQIGLRVSYQGLTFKNSQLVKQDFHHVHADLLWNVLGGLYKNDKPLNWSLSPFIGAGLMYNKSIGEKPFAFSYGLQGQYHFSERVSLIMQFSNSTTLQQFDGYKKGSGFGDNMMSLTAGFSFRIGKVGWKRPVDPIPYIEQNERLVDYARLLQEENAKHEQQHETDKQTLMQLKKILEIEGLLDTYKSLFEDEHELGKSFPKNNYSGLNSLRARLRNRQWNGQNPEGCSKGLLTATETDTRDSVRSHGFKDAVNDTIFMTGINDEMVGAPIYFFFNIGTCKLTDPSQKLNIDELARVAIKHNLYLTVIGAADSATGTSELNNKLSASRAEFISQLLESRGVKTSHIKKAKKGGVSEHNPAETNRYTKVILQLNPYK